MDKANLIKCFFAVLFLVGWIAGSPGCAGTSTRESVGEYVDSSVLTSKVKAAIFNDPMLKVLQINVETFKDVVQLSGFVDSPEAAARAVEVARSVEGVRAVENKMSVK
ncbi:MAG: BON domain-containing protein [Planctomycetia bacterium]|nr:BON domain-containing protein [Planctomycetia bacterium]